MNDNPVEIFEAVRTGKYPEGTKASDLATMLTIHNGNTLLHDAAANGQLPPGTTAEDLTLCKNTAEVTPLHEAAYSGHLPPDTTIQILSQTKDNEGRSALFYTCNGLHPDLTILDKATLIDLLNDIDQNGISVLEQLCKEHGRAEETHNQIKHLIHRTHCSDPKQIKAIAVLTQKACPIETALWVAKQMKQVGNQKPNPVP